MKSYLSEIFSSVQGEGPYVGERHLFVRFADCHRDCIYCDTQTERTEAVAVEKVSGSGDFEQVPNPLSVEQLLEIIHAVDENRNNRRISITGGEPLLQAEFLAELLPLLRADGYNIHLETAGDLPDALEKITGLVDAVAMDVKLQSVTQEASTFPAHWQFLRACCDAWMEVFVKLVLSADMDEGELMDVMMGIYDAGGKDTLVIIQPMSKSENADAVPSGKQLLHWQDMVATLLPNVRVIPQTHLMMEML